MKLKWKSWEPTTFRTSHLRTLALHIHAYKNAKTTGVPLSQCKASEAYLKFDLLMLTYFQYSIDFIKKVLPLPYENPSHHFDGYPLWDSRPGLYT